MRHSREKGEDRIFDPDIEDAFRRLNTSCDVVHICHPMWLASIARHLRRKGHPVVLTLTDPWLLCPRQLLDRNNRLCNGPFSETGCIEPECHAAKTSRLREAKSFYSQVDEVVTASGFIPALFRPNGWVRDAMIVPHSVDYRNVKLPETMCFYERPKWFPSRM